MKALTRKTVSNRQYPERIIQFGEGNFLRAFVDWIIWNMNQKTDFNSSVVVVQPIANGMVDMLNSQDGLYHLILKGLEKGEAIYNIQLIDIISRGLNPYTQFKEYLELAENPDMRFIISNTTEAGIAFDPNNKFEDTPANSYPGKLVQLLYRRFERFNGAKDKGLIIFPCELIFENGRVLKECINKYIKHWNLSEEFSAWFEESCGVYSTLVDRIVPGYPREIANEIKEKIGFDDNLLDEGEIFHLWVIEAPEKVAEEFPADKAELNVIFVPSEEPYHERKVTLLNGPHTVLSPVGYLAGLNTVRECVEDDVIGAFVRKVMFDELLPTLNLPEDELIQFSNDVLDRFRNPYVKHLVTSIMLNSFPKYKTRDLPGLKTYLKRKDKLPDGLVLGLAAIITYYKGGKRGNDEIVIQDDQRIIDLLQHLWKTGDTNQIAKGVLAADFIWDEDLNDIPGLTDKVSNYLEAIQKRGMLNVVKEILI
ncbi:tagaturonate reductase [Dysgonomonas sp. Marseille-P4677]|uniref:tagaturonate reductase n=1 Tax=Dysgonomonas sp. Marseille-P4677 TaxID=2364790 RepID=UPI001914CD39|nr:tagaturonate reductase [Dysgonomonas sp. Marseille-P4677]MBK5720737.1 tagaturonate reductase [Dysgonomonas sp. Marseille-P4677]